MGPLRLAHRGDHRTVAENTLAAFHAALAVPGCDGLEFDVRTSADGVPVVIHDTTLRRVQGRPGRVGATTAADLAALGVPSLAAILADVPPDAFLDIELKGDHGPATFDVIEGRRGSALNRAVVSSFSPRTIARARRAQPRFRRWLNVVDLAPSTIAQAVRLGCAGVASDWRAIDRDSAARVAAAGLDLAAWTVRRRATWRRLADLGVMAMCVEAAALDGDGVGRR